MKYLIATSSSLLGAHEDVGVMIGPRQTGYRPFREGRQWGGDNDAFHGKFTPEGFERHLERMVPWRGTCLFQAVPDVVGDPLATLQLFGVWAQVVEDAGYPPAYVLQDGSEHLPIPDAARALFLGGSTAWKAANIAPATRRAYERGLHIHVGRVNSLRRCLECAAAGVDSVDGTYVGFRGLERGVREVSEWLTQSNAAIGLYHPQGVTP